MKNFQMNTNTLPIKLVNSPEEAPQYRTDPQYTEFNPASLLEAVVVRKGTVEGGDTVDLQFTDSAGNKFVAMTTGNIIKSLASLVNTNV